MGGGGMYNYIILLFMILSSSTLARDLTEEELERWFEGDEQALPYQDFSSDSELTFLQPNTKKRTPYSSTQLDVSEESLQHGWVFLEQCHDNLDPVPVAEVVYRFRAMRNLQVTYANDIASAIVEGQSVQLREVGQAARLCVKAEVQILQSRDSGGYFIFYGPFKRKFLDSYFPMHVILHINFPQNSLDFEKILPPAIDSYSVILQEGSLTADAWFSGELRFEVYFNDTR